MYTRAVIRVLERLGNSARLARLMAGEARIAYLPEETLMERQAARFRSLVQHAYLHVPYYREWMRAAGAEPGDLRSPGDLHRMPLVDKLELTLHPERFASAAHSGSDGLTLLSSGTSGRRRSFRYDTPALFEALAAGRRQRLALRTFVGRETGYREAVINREGSAGAQIRGFWESRMVNPRWIDLTRRRIPPGLPFSDLLAALNEFRPHVCHGFGSHVGAFLRWVWETGRHLEKPHVVTYGEDAMPACDRQLIEEQMGIPVMSYYEAIEALRIGFQCEARRGFHISVDQVAVRVVNAKGDEARPGERGELILTNLSNRATVVMNYRLGDLVTPGAGKCPCGRTLPLIADIDGRLDDLIERPDGSRLHALTVIPKLQAVPGLSQVQVIQKGVDEFLLRVVWERGAAQPGEELRRRMAEVLGDGVAITVEPVERLPQEPSGKVRTIVSGLKNG